MSRITNRCSGRGVDKMHAPLRTVSLHRGGYAPYGRRAAAELNRYALGMRQPSVHGAMVEGLARVGS
jgi:hypothetical protein